MKQSFSPAQHRLAALALQQELEVLDGVTRSIGIQGWESMQDYPQDRFDTLHALGLLPAWATDAVSLLGYSRRGGVLQKALDDLQSVPLTQEHYDQLVLWLVKSNTYWREGLDPFRDAEMFPRQGGEDMFALLADCGLLEPVGRKWRWVAALHPHLRPKPPVQEVPSAAYDSLPWLLWVKFTWAATRGGVHALGREVRLHWRGDCWHMMPKFHAEALHEFGLTEWAVFAKKFLPDLR